MMKLIILTNLILSIYLTTMKSPLKSNLIILLQAISLTLMMNLINKTSWISFMIFILYVGGLMIIFLYISSIAFNEINVNKNNYKSLITKLMLTFMSFMLINHLFNWENQNYENNLNFEDNFYFMNMFMMPNNLMIYFIMLILFFMLILIIWLLKNKKGPIRQKF
uniref:NADH dehydrogenase subunit 6 n=1 Tax=Hormaphis betulae TaxID=196469 RepID=A0A140CUW3_9HEMI|nr:NADH dehydrogenase subunit 6 [Hormaphis betulae]AMJ17087.1 NADH dehydrogenase subunit 6 [Hormaphis betulae]QNO35887.1 NADH dehydrogenase subunit 6 [Hormaphis betulae]